MPTCPHDNAFAIENAQVRLLHRDIGASKISLTALSLRSASSLWRAFIQRRRSAEESTEWVSPTRPATKQPASWRSLSPERAVRMADPAAPSQGNPGGASMQQLFISIQHSVKMNRFS
jgi:hypothetical protein